MSAFAWYAGAAETDLLATANYVVPVDVTSFTLTANAVGVHIVCPVSTMNMSLIFSNIGTGYDSPAVPRSKMSLSLGIGIT